MWDSPSVQLLNEFQLVKARYYPRWRSASQWTLRVGECVPGTMAEGWCIPEQRVILVSPLIEGTSEIEMRPLLVHEICHAVTEQSHGKKFRRRLRKAWERAEKLGDEPVAAQLKLEVEDLEERFQNPNYASNELRDFYDRIRMYVLLSDAPVGFDALMSAYAREFACEVGDILRWARRARQVYREALDELGPGNELEMN